MKMTKTVRGEPTQWRRFKCTCGHCEDRKDDNSPVWMPRSLVAVDAFQELPLDEKDGAPHPVK